MWHIVYCVVYSLQCGILFTVWHFVYSVVYCLPCAILFTVWYIVYHVLFCLQCGIDLWTVAETYVFFEKIILKVCKHFEHTLTTTNNIIRVNCRQSVVPILAYTI